MRAFLIVMASVAFVGGLSNGSPEPPAKPTPKLDVVQPIDPTVLPPIVEPEEPAKCEVKSLYPESTDPLTGIEVNKPTVIMVSASWCGPCQAWKRGPVPTDLENKGWTLVVADVTEDQWKHIKVSSYPTYRIYDGKKWVQTSGALTGTRMKAALNPSKGPVRRVIQNTMTSVQSRPEAYVGRWQNHNGKSRMQHAVEDHGIDIRGKSESQVLREMDAYHDRYGGGHPARASLAVRSSGCPSGGCPPQRRSLFARR